MSVVQFLTHHVTKLHRAMDAAIGDLSLEQLHWRPTPQTNHAAFVAWHCSRTEDNIIQFVVRRKPTLWMEEGWDKRFGLDSRAQGTGMSAEEAGRIRFPSVQEPHTYMSRVFQATERFVATLIQDSLVQRYRVRMAGSNDLQELPLEHLLGTTVLTHGYSHLGELWVLRGLQGLRGAD